MHTFQNLECESKVRSTRSDSRARYRLSPTPFYFFLSPQQLELSRDESRRWFQSADPWKSPSGSLTPSWASWEFRSGKRKSSELRWWEREGRARGRKTWHREAGEVYSTSILSYSSYPLAISSAISPSRLIELVVYTYTTHNDSSVRKKEGMCLCFSFSVSLYSFLSRYLNIHFGEGQNLKMLGNWTRLNKVISLVIPESNEPSSTRNRKSKRCYIIFW